LAGAAVPERRPLPQEACRKDPEMRQRRPNESMSISPLHATLAHALSGVRRASLSWGGRASPFTQWRRGLNLSVVVAEPILFAPSTELKAIDLPEGWTRLLELQ